MIHLMLKHITYKNSLSKVITKSFHPNANHLYITIVHDLFEFGSIASEVPHSR